MPRATSAHVPTTTSPLQLPKTLHFPGHHRKGEWGEVTGPRDLALLCEGMGQCEMLG
jgi:hypothetical protein